MTGATISIGSLRLSAFLSPQILPISSSDLIQIIAFVFGVLWLLVTLYSFLPIVQFALTKLVNEHTNISNELGNLVVNRADDLSEYSPVIDVLVPAYDDAKVVEQAIRSLRKTNYPDSELNVHVLIEPDDEATATKLADLEATYEFTVHTVPSSYPNQPNKPRALDYGFNVTSGDIVGVIDAEDIVDPDLFGHVVSGLYAEEKDFVQGKLDMVNEYDGWKNLLFRAEYGYWYEILLKGFYTAGYPVPLGGTTNFFHRSTLESVSAIRDRDYGSPWPEESEDWFEDNPVGRAAPWDPRNVTEDFELGLLLWLHDFEIGYLDVATSEESPIDYNNWITQRTRWEKGKIYTMFQWFRYPPQGIKNKAHLIFQSFLPHYAVINVTGIVLLLLYSNLYQIRLLDRNQLLLLLTASIVVVLALIHGYAYTLVSDYPSRWRRAARSVVAAVTLPFYWALYWAATLRAIYQIYTGDLVWEKTEHHGRNDDTSEGGD